MMGLKNFSEARGSLRTVGRVAGSKGVPRKQERQTDAKKLRELFPDDTTPVDDVANQQRWPQPAQWSGQVPFAFVVKKDRMDGTDKYLSVPTIPTIRAIGSGRGQVTAILSLELLPGPLQLTTKLPDSAGADVELPANGRGCLPAQEPCGDLRG
jgi:hypothetical protein